MNDTENRPIPKSKLKRIAEGFAIVAQYTVGDGGNVSAEHDEVFVGDRKAYDAMPPSWRERMDALGWTWDEKYACWRAFV